MNDPVVPAVVLTMLLMLILSFFVWDALGLVRKDQVIVATARKFIGVVEDAPNDGETVRLIQANLDGVAIKEPWDMAFVQFVLDSTGDNKLYKSEHVYTVWSRTPAKRRKAFPSPGYIAVWQKIVSGKLTTGGHVGIVESVDGENFSTIEGNVHEEGKQGVFIKSRHLGLDGSMKLLGFLRPW